MPFIDGRDVYNGSLQGEKLGETIRNESGSTMAAGSLVYVSGWSETYKAWLVSLADADAVGGRAAYILRSALANNTTGRGFKALRLRGVNTNGATVGEPVYLSGTAGSWTLTRPTAAAAKVQVVGRVAVVSATVGEIEIDIFAHQADDALSDSTIKTVEVSLTNAEMLALRAAPKTLVAAPGAGKVLEFLSAVLVFDYTGAYTETADNMAIRYTDGSGTIVSEAIEATGFVDATADTMTTARPKVDVIAAKTACENKALVLHNTGDGEYGGGNAANAVRVTISYRVLPTGW